MRARRLLHAITRRIPAIPIGRAARPHLSVARDPEGGQELGNPERDAGHKLRVVPGKSNADLVAAARTEMTRSRNLLRHGDLKDAARAARRGFSAARAQRSHQLMSEAWIGLLEVLAADPDNDLTIEYRVTVEGAFSWAETMPEEIQLWFFLSLEPHLETLGFRRLVERSRVRREKAAVWLQRGNINVTTRLQAFHLADLETRRPVDRKALALERTASFFADELFDPQGLMLDDAAEAWTRAGRPDRAEFLRTLADELRNR